MPPDRGPDWRRMRCGSRRCRAAFGGFAIQEVAPRRCRRRNAGRTPQVRARPVGPSPPARAEDTWRLAMPGAAGRESSDDAALRRHQAHRAGAAAEVESVIPFDLAEGDLGPRRARAGGGKTEVLVGVVKKTVLREYLDALAAAGIEPRVVTFAPLRSPAGEKNLLGAEPPTAALLDAGPNRGESGTARGRPARAGALVASRARRPGRRQRATRRAVAPALRVHTRVQDLAPVAKGEPPQKLLLAGRLALLPGNGGRLGADRSTCPASRSPCPRAPRGRAGAGARRARQTPRGKINFLKDEFAFTKDLSQLRGQILKLSHRGRDSARARARLGMARLSSLHRQAAL